MPAETFLWLVAQALFLGVFLVVGLEFVRRPEPVRGDIALFFGLIAGILVVSDLPHLGPLSGVAWLPSATFALVCALPFVMLRLVDDFAPQRPALMAAAFTVTLALVVAPFLVVQPWPIWFEALAELWFIGLGGYASAAFLRGSARGRGVTSRRMLAVAIGSALLALVLLVALLQLFVPGPAEVATIVSRTLALGAGIAYLLGFAPPSVLRRAWQEPELRAFLQRAAELPRLPDTTAMVRTLEVGAAESTGATWAVIGLWDPMRHVLRYRRRDGSLYETPDDQLVAGMAFTRGEPIFVANAARMDPEHADLYRTTGATAILAAPITAGERRLGVLNVYAARASIFAQDDLELVRILAEQAAVVLESRALIDEAARVAAREEATRMKDDFLSAAAHDLRTPLTTLLLHAELLQRETAEDRPDRRRVDVIADEARRLRELVSDLLDGMQAERGRLVLRREETDLARLVTELCAAHSGASHVCRAQAPTPVLAEVDPSRIRQLVDNLLDNATKYSPDGGEVLVEVAAEGGDARISVVDHGIGIPPEDLPRLFDRFHRGGNVDDRRFQGLGLGLFISNAIVEQHGGRIEVTSQLGAGTRIDVHLPMRARNAAEPGNEPDVSPDPEQAMPGSRLGPATLEMPLDA